MLQTNELNDINAVLKGYSSYGYLNQAAMDADINFVASRIELLFKSGTLVGIAQYEYVKSLNGSYGNVLSYSNLYLAEVYAIANAFVSHAINKNIKSTGGFHFISLPDYSESISGNNWYDTDQISLRNNYLLHMMEAGYRVGSVRI